MTDTCNTYALHNLVSEPTCFKSINPTLLDVILATKPKRFTTVLSCSCWLSDCHNIVCVSTKLSLPRRNDRHILYRSFKHFDEFHFDADLLRATDNLIYPSTDVNSCLGIFQKVLRAEIDKHVPLKSNSRKERSDLSITTLLLINVCFLNNLTTFLFAMRCLALEVFKCMNGLSPSYIKDLFEMNMNSYDLRDNKKLVQPRVKTTLYELRVIRYYGAHIWNMLPVQYKVCVDVHDFRKLLLTWYGPNCSCSVCMQARRWNIIIFSFYLYRACLL